MRIIANAINPLEPFHEIILTESIKIEHLFEEVCNLINPIHNFTKNITFRHLARKEKDIISYLAGTLFPIPTVSVKNCYCRKTMTAATTTLDRRVSIMLLHE